MNPITSVPLPDPSLPDMTQLFADPGAPPPNPFYRSTAPGAPLNIAISKAALPSWWIYAAAALALVLVLDG